MVSGRQRVKQGCIFSPYSVCMQNIWKTGPDSERVEIGRRNINKVRYADDAISLAESSNDMKWLLIKVKEESAKTTAFEHQEGKNIMTTEEMHNSNGDTEDTEIVKDCWPWFTHQFIWRLQRRHHERAETWKSSKGRIRKGHKSKDVSL